MQKHMIMFECEWKHYKDEKNWLFYFLLIVYFLTLFSLFLVGIMKNNIYIIIYRFLSQKVTVCVVTSLIVSEDVEVQPMMTSSKPDADLPPPSLWCCCCCCCCCHVDTYYRSILSKDINQFRCNHCVWFIHDNQKVNW